MDDLTNHSPLWSVVLAGGQGERLKPLILSWLGRHRPKQYCTFVGTRSMLQHTLDRAAKLSAPKRIVTVIAQEHRREAWTHFEGRAVGTVLLQPKNRDTAAGIFLPLTYIRSRDPDATVVIYPSDHFVYPESRLTDAVQRAVWAVERLPDRPVLLGVAPDRLELDYGWIQPGQHLASSGGQQVQTVRAFLEKPTTAQADASLHAGALWNTLVLAAKVEALWKLGWRSFPDMIPLFERLGGAIGTSQEGTILEAIYREMPAWNFSSGFLQRVPEHIAVMEMDGVLWSDWGRPERIVNTLRRIGRQPSFPLECLTRPFTPIPLASGEPI